MRRSSRVARRSRPRRCCLCRWRDTRPSRRTHRVCRDCRRRRKSYPRVWGPRSSRYPCERRKGPHRCTDWMTPGRPSPRRLGSRTDPLGTGRDLYRDCRRVSRRQRHAARNRPLGHKRPGDILPHQDICGSRFRHTVPPDMNPRPCMGWRRRNQRRWVGLHRLRCCLDRRNERPNIRACTGSQSLPRQSRHRSRRSDTARPRTRRRWSPARSVRLRRHVKRRRRIRHRERQPVARVGRRNDSRNRHPSYIRRLLRTRILRRAMLASCKS